MPLTAMRTQVATDLAPLDATIYDAWPDEPQLPCVYVSPPLDAYVRAGQTFGDYVLSIDLVILVDHGEPDASLALLETLIEDAIANTMDWALTGVDPPSPLTMTESGAEYLGTLVHISKAFRL